MNSEKYEYLVVKNMSRVVGILLIIVGVLLACDSYNNQAYLFNYILAGLILIICGVVLVYNKIVLSGSQLKIRKFGRKTRIYNISELFIRYSKDNVGTFDSGMGGITTKYTIFIDNKKIAKIDDNKSNQPIINKLYTRGIKKYNK